MYHHDPFHGHSHFCVEAKFHWLDDVCTHLGSWWCQRRQGKTHCFTTGRPQCGFLEDNDSDGDGGGAEEAWDDFLISVLMTTTVPILMSLLLLEVRLNQLLKHLWLMQTYPSLCLSVFTSMSLTLALTTSFFVSSRILMKILNRVSNVGEMLVTCWWHSVIDHYPQVRNVQISKWSQWVECHCYHWEQWDQYCVIGCCPNVGVKSPTNTDVILSLVFPSTVLSLLVTMTTES